MLSVAMLVIVMSVMNGFRGELLDKIVGLNGHAIVQAYGGKLTDWEDVLIQVKETPEVTDASPLIERPTVATFNGVTAAIFLRGQIAQRERRPHHQLLFGRVRLGHAQQTLHAGAVEGGGALAAIAVEGEDRVDAGQVTHDLWAVDELPAEVVHCGEAVGREELLSPPLAVEDVADARGHLKGDLHPN